MPDDDDSDDLDLDALDAERARLERRLLLLQVRYDRLRAEQARRCSRKAVAARMGISVDELRKIERIAFLKARRALLQLL